jgi:hypothetical protein
MPRPTKRITFKTLAEFKRRIAALPTEPTGQGCQLIRTRAGVVCKGLCAPGQGCVTTVSAIGVSCRCPPK